jgi:hypothetical protein
MKSWLILPLIPVLASAAIKPAPAGHAANEVVSVEAKLYTDKEAIRELLGDDLGGYYVVVQVVVTPQTKLAVTRDDFRLRTDRDGEKSKPFSPSQIAGKGVMVVSSTGGGGGGTMAQDSPGGPIWGGIGGTRPQRGPSDGGGVGSSTSDTTLADAKIDTGSKTKDNPLQAALAQRIFPEEKTTSEEIAGLLYFPMEPKQKPKQLELICTTPKGKLSLRFK